jgi:hypothetical protein
LETKSIDSKGINSKPNLGSALLCSTSDNELFFKKMTEKENYSNFCHFDTRLLNFGHSGA